jgi:hypothetical protein
MRKSLNLTQSNTCLGSAITDACGFWGEKSVSDDGMKERGGKDQVFMSKIGGEGSIYLIDRWKGTLICVCNGYTQIKSSMKRKRKKIDRLLAFGK